MKDLIRNKEGRPTDCTRNRANFNFFQMMRYVVWPHLKYDLEQLPGEFWEGLTKIGACLLYIILLPVLPFTSAIIFKLRAKKEIKKYNKEKA